MKAIKGQSRPELRFTQLWCRLAGHHGDAEQVLARLVRGYQEPHRDYHNAVHIADCLELFDAASNYATQPDEVEAAVWFHDVVYDSRSNSNEHDSALWAADELRRGGAHSDVIRRVVELIEATKHDSDPKSPDSELLLDVDLSILGRNPDEFAVYDRAIRQEFLWVPEETYRAGRAAVLSRFLARPVIFHTEFFRSRFEKRARWNLTECIAKLTRGIADSVVAMPT